MIIKVYKGTKPRFDMCGQRLPIPIEEVEKETISPSLVDNLCQYAYSRMEDHGVYPLDSWDIVTETYDGHEPDEYDRVYVVKWYNKKGAEMGIQGIFVDASGEPFLDHGPFLDFQSVYEEGE